MFSLIIETDNAAFEDRAMEVARILRLAADQVAVGREEFNLTDYNGNNVGSASFE